MKNLLIFTILSFSINVLALDCKKAWIEINTSTRISIDAHGAFYFKDGSESNAEKVLSLSSGKKKTRKQNRDKYNYCIFKPYDTPKNTDYSNEYVNAGYYDILNKSSYDKDDKQYFPLVNNFLDNLNDNPSISYFVPIYNPFRSFILYSVKCSKQSNSPYRIEHFNKATGNKVILHCKK